ncbi:MAG: T9SS type A sorting domain-containing protein [Saprospiraceae bacterium]|nr:T9SS type A sorting domain-containing protein [Saprospiraceae bacterium]
MSRFTLILFFFPLSFSLAAQQYNICMDVVASSGGFGVQSNRYIAWTVGESFARTLDGSGYAFTQGFMQPDPCGSNLVRTHDLADWQLGLFPNPTEGLLTLRYSPEKQGYLFASVVDILGKPIMSPQKMTSPEASYIDASTWPAGVYFLFLQDPVSKASTTLRIVRL